MAFPVVQATNNSTQTAATTHTVSLPAGISSGDLLIVILEVPGTIASFTGYISLISGRGIGFLYYRIADGSEGATTTFTTSASTLSVHNTYRISGHQGTTPEATTAAGLDPPSLTPTWGSADTLFIAAICATVIFGSAGDITAAPTNYGSLIKSGELNDGVNRYRAGSAVRSLTGVSDDPGTFTVSSYTDGDAFTIGVRPVSASGGTRTYGYIIG
jgi:hypothetical protein